MGLFRRSKTTKSSGQLHQQFTSHDYLDPSHSSSHSSKPGHHQSSTAPGDSSAGRGSSSTANTIYSTASSAGDHFRHHHGSGTHHLTSWKGNRKKMSESPSTPGPENFPIARETPEVEDPAPAAPDPNVDPAGYLRSIQAVRERCMVVYGKAKKNQLEHFDVDWDKLDQTVKWVEGIIKRDFSGDYSKIPPHGRWQHFNVGGRPRVEQLVSSWPTSLVDAQERTRRLIDLFVVSVLLDAGAGTKWQYKSKENGKVYNRSEGLAVASIEMFKSGVFSSHPTEACIVDATALKKLTPQVLAKGLQVSEQNPIEGLDGRTGLLVRLGDALIATPEMFGATQRPGNMIDYLLAHPTTKAAGGPVIQTTTLWDVLMTGLAPIWPSSRFQVNGVPLGDAWPCTALPSSPEWETIVPFHKLTQWLAYSLMEPMKRTMNARFTHVGLMTGLPEYRNGGLLVDTGLLTLKDADLKRGEEQYHEYARAKGVQSMEVVPAFEPSDDVIVEWRACTVGFLDEIASQVNDLLGLKGKDRLNLAQVLEAGTWKGGREIAAVSRPNTKEPPIMIISDGTVF